MPSLFSIFRSTRRLQWLSFALLGGIVLFTPPALANDDEEDLSFEQRLIHRLLGGGGDSIEYRERSPLVIPPSGNLPPPAAENSAAKMSPAWPNDPDRNKKKSVKSGNKPGIDAVNESQRPLRPDELRQGTAPRTASAGPAQSQDLNSTGRPLRPDQMGETKSLHGLFGLGGGGSKAESASVDPPTRTKLTEPPTAYRTPAGNQPYTAPKEETWTDKINPWSRGTCDKGSGAGC